jgi:hypothetical protein
MGPVLLDKIGVRINAPPFLTQIILQELPYFLPEIFLLVCESKVHVLAF